MRITARPTIITAVAIASSLAGVGAAIAADAATPTRVTVTPVPTLRAGDRAPGDAPGVKAIRLRKTIPGGFVLLGQKVDVQRGDQPAGAALRFTCPGDKRLQTFLTTGQAGFGAGRPYRNHKSTFITNFPSAKLKQTSGVVYAVCR